MPPKHAAGSASGRANNGGSKQKGASNKAGPKQKSAKNEVDLVDEGMQAVVMLDSQEQGLDPLTLDCPKVCAKRGIYVQSCMVILCKNA